MQMTEIEQTSSNKGPGLTLARVEIGLGLLIFVYATLSPMIGQMWPVLEPDVLYGLWPLVLMFAGLWLVVAGGGIIKYPRWSLLMHLPLVVWLGFSWYAFS